MAQVRLKNDLCRFSPRLPKTDAIRVSSVSKYGIKKIGILRYGSSTKTDVKCEEKSTCANKYSAAQPTTCGIVPASQNKCSILDLAPEPSHNRRYVANCDFLSNPFFLFSMLYSLCFAFLSKSGARKIFAAHRLFPAHPSSLLQMHRLFDPSRRRHFRLCS